MSANKHTPGPWHCHLHDDGAISIVGPYGIPVCWRASPFVNDDKPRIEADGLLIASAPDILAERDALRERVAKLEEEKAALLEACDGILFDYETTGGFIRLRDSEALIWIREAVSGMRGEEA